MPTIDQLAPAIAASDTDEMLVSQNGVARKITRRQIINGLQAELLIAPGTLLGRSAAAGGVGNPQPVTVGANLSFNQGTLAAAASPYNVAGLSAGTVPGAGDLVPLGQASRNTAVPYAQFMAGLPSVPGVDGSALTVRPTGGGGSATLADFAASVMPRGGGTLTGPLTLSADPSEPMQASTRHYVDAATANKLDLLLGTEQSMAGRLHVPSFYSEQQGSAPGDYAVLNSRYTVNHSGGTYAAVNSNARLDTTVFGGPNSFVWGLTSTLNYQGTGGTGQHVAVYAQVLRDAVSPGGAASNPQLWAATMESRDTTGRPSSASNGQLAVEMDIIANGADDGGPGGSGVRQIQSLVIGQHDGSGAPVEVSVGTGYYLAGGSKGSLKQVIHVGTPFSQSAFDTRIGTQLPGGHAVWLADGHHIAVNSAGTRYLAYDGGTDELRYYRDGTFVPLGSGVSYNAEVVLTGDATLLSGYAGDAIFVVTTKPSTITLPRASDMQFGTGFTVLVVGTATVAIVSAVGNSIDNGPVTLFPGDRYSLISDGANSWREIWRSNSMQTRFTSPPVLPSYTVASLPVNPIAGSKAYASNGRKGTDAAGAGTGVEVFADSTGRWISIIGGNVVGA